MFSTKTDSEDIMFLKQSGALPTVFDKANEIQIQKDTVLKQSRALLTAFATKAVFIEKKWMPKKLVSARLKQIQICSSSLAYNMRSKNIAQYKDDSSGFVSCIFKTIFSEQRESIKLPNKA